METPASITEMATARYYPGPFESHASRPLDARSIVYLAVGVAVLSALSVFFLLWERDHSFLSQVSLYESQQYVRQVSTSAPATTAPAAVPVKAASVQTVPAYIPFDVTRSRHFQRVGPVSIGLWRTDARHGNYDVSLVVAGQRFDKKHVGMDQALAIRIGDSAPMELVVNRIGKNDVAGYLTTPNQSPAR